jgi:dynein heavy chain, axonemal
LTGSSSGRIGHRLSDTDNLSEQEREEIEIKKEHVLLIRAMRDANVPKFVAHDLPIFYAIIQDLFPGLKIPIIQQKSLKIAIEESFRKENLEVVPCSVNKCIQLYETCNVRFGVTLVGQTMGGKSVFENS